MSLLRVLVGCKKVIDYSVKVRVKPDYNGVVTEGVKHILNPFDEISLEEAIRMKEKKLTSEVIACSCSPLKHKDVLQQAMAMGADSAIHMVVSDDQYEKLQPLAVALMLAKIIQMKNINFVLLGKQAIDDDCNQTGSLLAALLDWPQGSTVSKLEIMPDHVIVNRDIDGGSEKIKLRIPCIITTDLRLNTPRYPTLPNIMKARSKPIEQLTPEQINVDILPHLELSNFCYPPPRTGGNKVASTDELLKILEQKGFIKLH